jgi:hypothetical protein
MINGGEWLLNWTNTPRRAIVMLVWGMSLGCNDITRVSDPALVTPPDVQSAAGANNLRNGAVNDLFGNFSQQAVFTGLFVDEFTVASAQYATGYPEDQRILTAGVPGNFPFSGLSDGRINALIAIPALKQFAPTPAWHIGELYALIAATEIDFAEDLCSGVPLAVVTGFTPSYGSSLSRQQMLNRALLDLDSAAVYSTQSDSIANLVAVLRGRAYADSGNLPQASTVVQNVPLAFAYTAELSDTTNVNQIYAQIVVNQSLTVSDVEGINGLPFVSAADPRVAPVAVQGASPPIYVSANATSGSSPVILASGIEAQLLMAEADLSAGQVNSWAAILNNLRQNAITPAMSALSTDSTTTASPSARLAVMFRERAFWLFASGHREGDLRRLVRQYGLPANTLYPIGAYLGGPATYGSSVVYPVGGEQYDPNFHGCLNLGP